MGYLYRPMLKGKQPDFTLTPEDLSLSRGRRMTGSATTPPTVGPTCAPAAGPGSGRCGGSSIT